MIILLSGAKKNIGDYIITDRVRALLEHLTDDEIHWLPNWQTLDGHEELIRNARAVVIAGGPGYRPNLYGGVYPLFSDPHKLARLGVAVRFLGLGWKGDPGDSYDLAHYFFNEATMTLLHGLGQSVRCSARDHLSAAVLCQNGIDGVMSGCPVWYHLESLGKDLIVPTSLRRIVFTPPEQLVFFAQSRCVLNALREEYPQAEITVAFHRGIDADEYTTPATARALTDYAAFARSIGCEPRDVSYDLSRIAFYDEADMHVGYRLHGHLYFLSKRRPSILLEEDGRGRGASEVLQAPGVGAWELTSAGRWSRRLPPSRITRRLLRGKAVKGSRPQAVHDTLAALQREVDSDFAACRCAVRRIDATWPTMEAFLRGI